MGGGGAGECERWKCGWGAGVGVSGARGGRECEQGGEEGSAPRRRQQVRTSASAIADAV